MVKGIYQKIVIFLLLAIILLVHGFSKSVHYSYYYVKEQPTQSIDEPSYYSDKDQPNSTSEVLECNHEKQLLLTSEEHNNKQQLNLTSEKVQLCDKKQIILPPEFNQHLIKLAYNKTEYRDYVKKLSSVQLNDLVRQMGISNLTSTQAQKAFINCAGMFLLRMLKGNNQTHPYILNCQHCKSMSFKSSGPVVTLVSFPSSGNSWVRQLLEAATGIYTGAATGYCDQHYVYAGMIGENVGTNNVLVVKVHGSPIQVKRNAKSSKVIYIIRNPFEVFVAENNRNIAMTSKKYSTRNNHKVEVDFNYVNNPAWNLWVKKESIKWKVQVMQWLKYREIPVLIVGYENLMKDTYTELKRMLDFIGYSYTEDDIKCAVETPSESFHRNHTKKHIQPYSPDLQNYVLSKIQEINADLLKHNISILYFPYKEA